MAALRRGVYCVTTPIFYVNSVPHIGHLYSAVMADTLTRWAKMKGHRVVLSTGTDEHGLKIQQAAERSGTDPQVFCDGVSAKFRELFDRADIKYTDFIRTSEPRHKEAVVALWKKLREKGYIYKHRYEGWYSVADECFYAASEVVQLKNKTNMVSKETGQPVEWTTEDNYMFRLTAFKSQLTHWIVNSNAVQPAPRANHILSFLNSSEFTDLSISRPSARVPWGILVPNDPDHTVYVWLDALTNYLTVAGYPTRSVVSDGHNDVWPPDVQIVGKDILKFHALYWPAFLMACEFPLPRQILAHAHWTLGRSKMSKSRGNVVDPNEMITKYGSDAVRFFLMLNGGILDDGDWSEQTLQKVYRKELAGQLGNLFSRAASEALNPSGMMPLPDLDTLDDSDKIFRGIMTHVAVKVDWHMELREFNKAMTCIIDLLSEANKYFTHNTPWALQQGSPRLSTVLYHSLECTRLTALLLQAVMPNKASQLLDLLNVDKHERLLSNVALGTGWQGRYEHGRLGEHTEQLRIPIGRETLFPKIQTVNTNL